MKVTERLRRELALCMVLGILFTGCSKKMGDSGGTNSKAAGAANTFYHPTPDDIVQDPETGLDITKGILNITFSKKMDETAIKGLISSFNGEIVGQDRAARFYQVRFKDAQSLSDLDNIAKKLLAGKEVELASRNSVSVHTDPYYVR